MTVIRVGICSLLAFMVLTDGGLPDWSAAIFELGAAVLFVLWSVRALRHRVVDIRRSLLYFPVLSLIALCLAQNVFGVSVYAYATKIELLKWIAYFALAFLAVQSFRTPVQLRSLSIFLLTFGFLVALFAIAEHYTFNGRLYWFLPLPQSSEPFGPFVDRDHFAGFIELTAPFGFAMLLDGKWRGAKTVFVVLLTSVPIAALILCGSRGGIAAFVFAILLLIFMLRRRNARIRQFVVFGSLAALSATLVLWFGAAVTMQRFKTLTASNISRDQRLSLYSGAWRIFLDNPSIGTGLGTLETVFPQYETYYNGRVVDHAHNDYLELLAETGATGGLLGLAFIVLLCRRGIANFNSSEHGAEHAFHAGALAACGALLAHSFVDFNLHVPSNALLFLILGTLASADRDGISVGTCKRPDQIARRKRGPARDYSASRPAAAAR